MRIVLKEFQVTAVDELTDKLRRSAREVRQSGEAQAIGLSSPTGSGKTVMVTAAMESLVTGDDANLPVNDAVFLWITDQPQLNEQTRRRIIKHSSLFDDINIVTLGPSFDQESFTPGTVNFLNIQKLGKERDLITKTDDRHFTIWETITNTAAAIPDRFFVIIDEAHRGMSEGPKAIAEANTIIQKFIKDSPGEMPKIPLVLGISATIERYNNLVSGTGRTMRSVDVPVEDVRSSGLLKDVVTLYHPSEDQPTDMTMLRQAAKTWRETSKKWEDYCKDEDEAIVRPILVVQVQDGTAKQPSKTNLAEALTVLQDEIPGLSPESVAHAFQEAAPISIDGRSIRYIAPPDVDGDDDVRIVFFKTSLSTGWDCPRAEVMMSFRTALDATSIAQLVGRMVRTPLGRRVQSNESLNTVGLYLPHYDKKELQKVVTRLTTPDPDSIPPIEFRSGNDSVTLTRASGAEDAFLALESLPTYVVPAKRKSSQLRRLMKLARALENDEIGDSCESSALDLLNDLIHQRFETLKSTGPFVKLVKERKEIEVRAVDWQVGLDSVEDETLIKLKVSSENMDDMFEDAGRRIGDEGLHKEWLKRRRGQGIATTEAKLELIALSVDSNLRRSLEVAARKQVQEWLRDHAKEIAALPEKRQATYEDIRGRAIEPELSRLNLPAEMSVSKSDTYIDGNIYRDSSGKYPATLNGWETMVVKQELANKPDCLWHRNADRKAWSLTVPYEPEGQPKPFYPDFVFLSKQGDDWKCDLLDPHHIDLADAPAKAVGLAKYAAKHHASFNRIELIIIRGKDDIRRIDLTDEAKREKVLKANTKEYLALLFDED